MRFQHELLRRLRDPRGPGADQGWARRSLEVSIARPLLIGMAILQAVMVLAVLASLGRDLVGLLVAISHLAAAALALAVLRFDRGHVASILGSWMLFLLDWSVSPTPESTLLFTACWLCNLNGALPAFLLRGKVSWLAPLGAAAAIPVLMILLRPDQSAHPLVPGVFVTTIAITLATRIGLSYLIDYTDRVDAEARELEETTAALTARTSATYQAAEDARVLHDTAINTLGAIANGGAAVADVDAVRQRCLADIAVIETLRSVTGDDVSTGPGFRDAIRPTGIRVRYAGMPDEEIANIEALLPPRVMRAFSRAAAEAVQNAAKHSGADEVVVSITRTADAVRVAVVDRGVGMEEQGRAQGSGIERSILERARSAGIRATIDSGPGAGTIVTLEYPLDAAADSSRALETGESGVEEVVRQLRSRSAFALSAGLVGVGVTLAALNHPGKATPEWLMVAVVAMTCWLAWRERDRPRLSVWTTIALIAAGPVAFFLSAWSVGFGRVNPILWQAIAPTGPLLALMMVVLPRATKRLGFAIYLLTVLAIAIHVASTSLEAAYITGIAGLLGFGLIAGVSSFVRKLAAIAARAHREQRETFTAGLQLATVGAAAESRRRWRDAGLEHSVSLLRAIGEGRVDPCDPAIQNRCAEEEAYLRQLSLLSPELIHMGTWFARALNASRLKGVRLTVRSGAADAKADDAQRLGGTLMAVVEAMPSGTKLTAALFATAQGLTMILVAPTPRLMAAFNPEGLWGRGLRVQTLDQQDFAELVVAGGES